MSSHYAPPAPRAGTYDSSQNPGNAQSSATPFMERTFPCGSLFGIPIKIHVLFPIYMLITTSCWQLGGPGTNDIEVFCGEGNYDAYNEMTWNIYGSKSGQCTGDAYKADRVNVRALNLNACPT